MKKKTKAKYKKDYLMITDSTRFRIDNQYQYISINIEVVDGFCCLGSIQPSTIMVQSLKKSATD